MSLTLVPCARVPARLNGVVHEASGQGPAAQCRHGGLRHSFVSRVNPKRHAGAVVCRSADVEADTLSRQASNDTNQRWQATFTAERSHSQPLKEKERSLHEYMTMPVSQYSVLDARKIERIDETAFRCYVGGLDFFGFKVEPVLTVQVTPEADGCTIRLLDTRLQGSALMEAQNNNFKATMTNRVSYRDVTEGDAEAGDKLISSTTQLNVSVQLPRMFRFMAGPGLDKAGSSVVSGVLATMVPQFCRQLRDDYYKWADGDNSRSPVAMEEDVDDDVD
eukprot:jgi/Mesvir1/26459/Mv16134-RA.1